MMHFSLSIIKKQHDAFYSEYHQEVTLYTSNNLLKCQIQGKKKEMVLCKYAPNS